MEKEGKKEMKKFLIIFVLVMCFCGCSFEKELSKEEKLQKVLSEKEYIVIDVRTKNEYDSGHVVGSINIPYDEINENINLAKDKPILVYCQSGRRSSIAYTALEKLGYEVFDLGAYATVSLEKE